jgi:hypothetical protein
MPKEKSVDSNASALSCVQENKALRVVADGDQQAVLGSLPKLLACRIIHRVSWFVEVPEKVVLR